ncbi:hemerythrin domain-containing protein [Archangium lipolyticum]|uniref:hemerythrin domain-containing protein n=1 Tax=Archangium lipolyticum TaxID=2970465 RepID=UPI002149F274|nr:hemerythrin domain-containing protein [Archangium lipolyticum]
MDAISLLKHDHETIRKLFKRYEALKHGGDLGKKQELSRRIILELSIHAAIEEQVFYPSVKAHDSGWTERIDEALEEHRVAKWELAALQRMVPDDPRFDARFTVLVQNVLHHIEEEEKGLFASLHRTFAREELNAMADALALAKRTVPTHPHPMLPDEPPGNLVMPLVAVFDRSRDLVTELVERSLAWVRQLVQGGRGRAKEVGAEAQRWTFEAPGRALKVSSDVLEETQDVARGATRSARRMAEQAVSDAATRMGNGESRRNGSSVHRAKASQARRPQEIVSRQTSVAAGKTARKRSTSGRGNSAGKSSPRA